MNEQYPKLMIVSRLVKPLNDAKDLLHEVKLQVTDEIHPILVKGALAMSVASMEAAIGDTFRYYLQHFHEKLSVVSLQVPPGTLPINTYHLLSDAAERHVNKTDWKSFKEQVRQYDKDLSINTLTAIPTVIDAVQEIIATRNLMLHNSLCVNDIYLSSAGPKRRHGSTGSTLQVDTEYVCSSVDALSDLLHSIVDQLQTKYAKYTKIEAHRKLWEYIFDNPRMPYDEYWTVDEEADRIKAATHGKAEDGCGGAELLFLGIWRAHFNSDTQYLAKFHMRKFDQDNTRKLHYLLSIAQTFPWE
jgi:hypothetical protein